MTGRRARPTYEARTSRAMQFVPGHVGGRVASAQPVQRTGGTLRRPSIGAAAPLETLAQYTSTTVTTSATEIPSNMAGTAAGDLIVCMVIARGYTISDPAGGWTNIASGTVTNLAYRVSWIVSTLSTMDNFGLSGAGTGAAMQMFAFRDAGGRTPAITGVSETTSASTVNFPAVPDAVASPWQVLGYLPTTPGAFTTTSSPAIIQTDQLSEIIVAGVLQLNVQQPRDPTWLDAFPGPVSTSSTLTTSAAGEWVRFGMGLV